MTDGLKDAHREAIIAQIAANQRVERAVLFGSRATGTNTATSDVDIALFGDRLTLTDQARLAAALDEIPMAQSVDLVLYDSIRDRELREHIRNQGVEWFARQASSSGSPEAWPVYRFRELLEGPVRNGIYKRKEHRGRGVKIVNMGELFAHPRLRAVPMRRVDLSESEMERFSIEEGDLLFARRSLVAEGAGKCCAVLDIDEPTTFESSIIRARPDPRRSDSLYLYYFFSSPSGLHLLDTIRRQVAVAGITGRDLSELTVPVPPAGHQRAIAGCLGALDDKIELNRRMNETLEAMARALFKSWFVDFDPVRAKMEDRATGWSQDIADLFPDRLVDSEMGEIPELWKVSEIGKEVDVVGGSTPSTKEVSYWHQGQHCWATPKDLSKLGSPVLLETGRKITDAGLRKISSGTLPVGTVLLSSRAPIGYLAIAEVPTAVNQGFIAMRCERRLPNLYVLEWCYQNLGYMRGIAGGSTFAEISKKAFRPVSVLVPSQAVLRMFERLTRPLYDRVVVNMKEAAALAVLRDTLLPKLISGEIRVPDAERALESAT